MYNYSDVCYPLYIVVHVLFICQLMFNYSIVCAGPCIYVFMYYSYMSANVLLFQYVCNFLYICVYVLLIYVCLCTTIPLCVNFLHICIRFTHISVNVQLFQRFVPLIVLEFNDTSTLVGHFVSSPREREKRYGRDGRGDEREGQGRKRNRNESEESDRGYTEPIPYPPTTPKPPLDSLCVVCVFSEIAQGAEEKQGFES